MPLLGLVADRHGPRGAFVVLAAIPLLAVTLSTALRGRPPPGLPKGAFRGIS